MFRLDYDTETIPFVIEGEHTHVFGVGEVAGKIAVAHVPLDIVRDERFDEPGIIPVILDEHAMTEYEGVLEEITSKLMSGIWAGFVTFGPSEKIKSNRNLGKQSHFMITLRGFGGSEGFIAVVDNDEASRLFDPVQAANLRSEVGMFDGIDSVLTAVSPAQATIEFDLDD